MVASAFELMDPFVLHFAGVGPQRTGTTLLHERLAAHPQVHLPRRLKETFFFDERYDKGLEWYAAHFSEDGAGLNGEFAPTYFDADPVPARLAAHNPELRIIAMLRDPVERTISLFHHHWTKGRLPANLREAVALMPRLVDSGRYAVHLPRWFTFFPSEHILPLTFDELVGGPSGIRRVTDFLAIEAIEITDIGRRVGATASPRHLPAARVVQRVGAALRRRGLHRTVAAAKALGLKRLIYRRGAAGLPIVTAEDRRWLASLFEADVAYVAQLIGRDRLWWR